MYITIAELLQTLNVSAQLSTRSIAGPESKGFINRFQTASADVLQGMDISSLGFIIQENAGISSLYFYLFMILKANRSSNIETL